jgi:hypothetical protein
VMMDEDGIGAARSATSIQHPDVRRSIALLEPCS